MMLRAFLGATLVFMAGCAGEEPDLEQQMRELTKDLRGRVEPLPQRKAPEPAVYRGAKFPDPFYPPEKKGR
jgi:Tfp pilus assembly protein PilP